MFNLREGEGRRGREEGEEKRGREGEGGGKRRGGGKRGREEGKEKEEGRRGEEKRAAADAQSHSQGCSLLTSLVYMKPNTTAPLASSRPATITTHTENCKQEMFVSLSR